MAEHPRSNGPYLGQYPPPPLPPMSASPGVQMPYYPQVHTIPPVNYAASQSAYDLNSIRIPGLGLGQETPMAATSFTPGAPQPWSAHGHNPQINSYYQSQHQPSPLPRQSHIPHQQSSNVLEEGELSEGGGEFEDLYEPGALTNAPQAQLQNKTAQPSANLNSRDSSVGDADGSSIYDPHEPRDEREHHAKQGNLPGVGRQSPDDDWEPSYPDRERSGSYSPYLSPREVHRKVSVAKAVSRDTKATDRTEPSQPTRPIGVPSSSASNMLSQPNNTTRASPPANKNAVPIPTAKHERRANGSTPFRSPLEAKKKAQEAILGLWPLKVRYQDYIDEGVDADVVKALFKDIGLDVPVAKTTVAPTKASNDVKPTPTKATTPSHIPPKPQNPSRDQGGNEVSCRGAQG
ncbi:hypothetical protein O1611_g6017 [Lasiodiplodia mahajangana]|uniref:Uncharacterized protein n=1 Tax=Lasiodiplodia mahajangana TaxID=1108764 RepID=A0ACC2JJR7_9PEZI|nr:hypothetical protein O1611_g6017 [Lasiodiplodia mahajangana]